MLNKKYLQIFGVVMPVIIFALFIHTRLLGKITDLDAFYHIKHAWIYATQGIFNSAFPWTQFSVIGQVGADLWYGFHILIIPFTLFPDLLDGIRYGAFFITITTFLLVYWALKRLRIKWPLFWLAVFGFASAVLLVRLTMLRPHSLSLALSLLLFAYLTTSHSELPAGGEISREKSLATNVNRQVRMTILGIFLTGLILSWLHIALAWLPILVAMMVLLMEILHRQKIYLSKYAALAIGLVAGVLLRPNPFGAIKLAYIQVVQLLFEKNLPLRFGVELYPYVWENFAEELIPITTLLIIGITFVGWLSYTKKLKEISAETKAPIFASLILTGFFALLTYAVARRSNDLFIGFGVILLGLIFTYWQSTRPVFHKKSTALNVIAIVMVIVLLYMPIKNIFLFDIYVFISFRRHGLAAERFKDLSLWLKENSRPEEIVFNIHWDNFAQLFFWNHNNYYINGMDPIFQYVFEPSSYWKVHYYAIDEAGPFTCGMTRCTPRENEYTPLVLKRNFNASYIMVEKHRNPKVFEYLDNAREFQKVFENGGEALYRIP